MSAGKPILILLVAAAMGLLYVHLNVEQILVSYRIKSAEEGYERLLDSSTHLRYTTIARGNCANLERVLVGRNTKIIWPAGRDVVVLAFLERHQPAYRGSSEVGMLHAMASIFSIKREAQARPITE